MSPTMPDISSQPFTRAEVRVVLLTADQLLYRRRDRSEDPTFYGRLLRVFLTFGPHPSVLPTWGADTNLKTRPTERGDRMYFLWEAPKEQRLHRAVEIEVPRSYEPWLPEFLDTPKPLAPETYWRLFKFVEDEMREQTRYDFPVNPRRARHTTAQQMLERGFTSIDVEAAIRVTPETLKTYGLSTPEQRGAKGEEIGWGNWD